MDDDGIQSLIGAIYEAPLEPQQWTYVVRRLKSETRSRFAHLWTGFVHAEVKDFVASPDQYLAFEHDRFSFSEVAAIGRSIQASSLRDPFVLRQSQVPIGRAFLGPELVSTDELKRSDYYSEFAGKIDACHILASLMIREGGNLNTISFFRPETYSPYTKREKQLLDVFIPHLTRSLDLYNRLQLANTQASILRNSFDALPSAIVLLKRNGKVIFLNRAAEDLIGRCAELHLRRDRLCAINHADTLKLEQLIGKVTGADTRRPLGEAITIQRSAADHPLQIMAAPVPLDSRAVLMPGLQPVAMLVIHDPDQKAQVPHETIAAMFGLTPSEARLCLALSQGQTVIKYAEESHVTQNTARTHLKSVFAKTKTSKQSDLVRLMSGLAHSGALFN
jgi:DNA-binding CsgD family transcriptional regulator/PAS domain-containing protein